MIQNIRRWLRWKIARMNVKVRAIKVIKEMLFVRPALCKDIQEYYRIVNRACRLRDILEKK